MDDTVIGMFAEMARRQPDAIAVVHNDQECTYGELNDASIRLVSELLARGAKSGDLIALCLARTQELCAAILATLRMGAGYVLLDPDDSDGPLRTQLSALSPDVIVTHEDKQCRLTDVVPAIIVCIDAATAPVSLEPAIRARPTDLACVLRSAGEKGLERQRWILHRHLAVAREGWSEVYELCPGDRYLQAASMPFEAFTGAWVNALCAGAALVITGRRFAPDLGDDLFEFLLAQQISVLECDVRLARDFVEALAERQELPESLRLLIVSGERWYLDEHVAAQQRLGDSVRVLHVYSVAETTLACCYFDVAGMPDAMQLNAAGARTVSIIGQPFPGVDIRVVAPSHDAAGELWVGGQRIGLSARTMRVNSTGDWYRTGDLVRSRPDGLLEFVGACDHQAGELDAIAIAEIESACRNHPDVQEAFVTTAEYNADPQDGTDALSIHIVPKAGRLVDADTVLAAAEATLRTKVGFDQVVVVRALSQTGSSSMDRMHLPQRLMPAAHLRSRSAKGLAIFDAPRPGSVRRRAFFCVTLLAMLICQCLTDEIWPGSTDVSQVPRDWALSFRALYLFETTAFGFGVSYLLFGFKSLAALRRPKWFTLLTHLSIAWLMMAWWPEDNMYRMSSATDWARQSQLVWTFNISSMIAGMIVALFAMSAFVTKGSPRTRGGSR